MSLEMCIFRHVVSSPWTSARRQCMSSQNIQGRALYSPSRNRGNSNFLYKYIPDSLISTISRRWLIYYIPDLIAHVSFLALDKLK